MKASEAKKLVQQYKEPKTLAGILKKIRQYSTLGFGNASFILEQGEERDKIIAKLEQLGYNITSRSYKDYIELEWW